MLSVPLGGFSGGTTGQSIMQHTATELSPPAVPTTHTSPELPCGRVTVVLTESDVDKFDVTRPREVDIEASLDERTPGGLGLYLLQNIVDKLDYEYQDRRSRVIFTKESG